MPQQTPFSPDAPELHLLGQLAGIKPSALAAALNDVENFSKHISAYEFSRFLEGVTRLYAVLIRVQSTLETELNRTLKTKGRRTNAR